MTTTDGVEWAQNDPLFETSLIAVAEGVDGSGVLAKGDMKVTATVNANEIQVATGDLWYTGDQTVYTIGTAETHTLSDNTSGSDRWDLVVFDTTLATPASDVIEGTAAADPDVPQPGAGQVVLAYIYVQDGETDVTDTEIKNWRMFSTDAGDVRYDDSTGNYSVSEVDAALDELSEAAQITGYPLPIGDLASPFALPSITDMDVGGNDLTDGATVIWDTSNSEIPQAQLGGPASSLTSYPLPSGDIATDAITTSELDLSISPTWTGTHTYDAAEAMAEVTTPTTPAAGYNKLYFKSDDLLYKLDDAGNEATVGAIESQDDGGTVVAATGTFDFQGGLAASNPTGSETEIDYEHAEVFEGRESGSVSSTNQGVLIMDHLADTESVEVYKAVLVKADGTAVGSSTTLELVTFDNAGAFTNQATLITGDGATIFDDETGTPLGSYTNSTGGGQTVGVLVDNQESSAISIITAVEGVTGL